LWYIIERPEQIESESVSESRLVGCVNLSRYPRFQSEIKVHLCRSPRTIDFWNQKLTRLLEFEPLAASPLDKINKL
ncbi:MAG: hypothetical protein LC775_09415, partial [Acidobacteria bacterium]|nr:hypothetical protein [Acidobacteriota bacterium]